MSTFAFPQVMNVAILSALQYKLYANWVCMHGAQRNGHICISDNVTPEENAGRCIKKRIWVEVEGGKVAFAFAEKEDVTKRSR